YTHCHGKTLFHRLRNQKRFSNNRAQTGSSVSTEGFFWGFGRKEGTAGRPNLLLRPLEAGQELTLSLEVGLITRSPRAPLCGSQSFPRLCAALVLLAEDKSGSAA